VLARFADAAKAVQRAFNGRAQRVFGALQPSLFTQILPPTGAGRPLLPEMVRAATPGAKVVVVVRDPAVAAALAILEYFVAPTGEKLLKGALSRIAGFEQCLRGGGGDPNDSEAVAAAGALGAYPRWRRDPLHCYLGPGDPLKRRRGVGLDRSWLGVGVYARALDAWWALLGPAQVLVLRADDLATLASTHASSGASGASGGASDGADRGKDALRRTLAFLDLSRASLPALAATAPAAFAAAAAAAGDESALGMRRRAVLRDSGGPALAQLRAFFAPHNRELAAMTGDLGFEWA
jgi:hypothetical protein